MLRKSRKKIKVEIYSKGDCPLCDKAKAVLQAAQAEFHLEIHEIDITSDPHLFQKYRESIPVIFINDRKAFKYRVDPQELRKTLRRLT